MNIKWCVSTFIIVLAIFGLSQGPTKASNQQIVFQFTDAALASESAHDQVLAALIQKLWALGINTIEVVENDGTQIKIRYYSDFDATKIKEFLCEENQLSLVNENGLPSDFPKEKLPEAYKLTVVDLHQQADNGFELNGILVTTQNEEYHGPFFPVTLQINGAMGVFQGTIVHQAYKINRAVVIAIDGTSPYIPEVRAGPYVQGNTNFPA